MGLDATKPVFRVSNKVRFIPACSATETCKTIEISFIANLDMILFKMRITKGLISLRLCCSQTTEDRFSRVAAHTRQAKAICNDFENGNVFSTFSYLFVVFVWFDSLRLSQQLWSCQDGKFT